MAKPKKPATKAKKPATRAKKPAKKPASKAKKPANKSAKPANKSARPGSRRPRVAKSGADDRWWDLIERSRKGDGDQADQLAELLAKELTADEILAFDRFLGERIRDAFRTDLWAIAYIMNGGCSDDGFDYFIGWLIGRGRTHYEAALANPEAAADGANPDDEPFENEMIWYVASNAWAAKTGKPKDDYYAVAPNVNRTLKGKDFDEDTVYGEHPKLAKKFGGG